MEEADLSCLSDHHTVDAERKRQLKQRYREQQAAEARARLGLSREQLTDLRDSLESNIWGLGIPCDHTLIRTREWAQKNGLDAEAVTAGVGHFGGFCDCEVANNVDPHLFGW